MRTVIITLFLMIAQTSPLSAAPAKTFAAKVAKAKADLRSGADKAFVNSWQKIHAEAAEQNLKAAHALQAAYWASPAYSLGICHDFVSESDLSFWKGKFESLDFGIGEFADKWRTTFWSIGMKTYYDGQIGGPLDRLTSEEKADLCSVELEAVRQFLDEM